MIVIGPHHEAVTKMQGLLLEWVAGSNAAERSEISRRVDDEILSFHGSLKAFEIDDPEFLNAIADPKLTCPRIPASM